MSRYLNKFVDYQSLFPFLNCQLTLYVDRLGDIIRKFLFLVVLVLCKEFTCYAVRPRYVRALDEGHLNWFGNGASV